MPSLFRSHYSSRKVHQRCSRHFLQQLPPQAFQSFPHRFGGRIGTLFRWHIRREPFEETLQCDLKDTSLGRGGQGLSPVGHHLFEPQHSSCPSTNSQSKCRRQCFLGNPQLLPIEQELRSFSFFHPIGKALEHHGRTVGVGVQRVAGAVVRERDVVQFEERI